MEVSQSHVQAVNQELLKCHLRSLHILAGGKLPSGLRVKVELISMAHIEDIVSDVDKLRAFLRK